MCSTLHSHDTIWDLFLACTSKLWESNTDSILWIENEVKTSVNWDRKRRLYNMLESIESQVSAVYRQSLLLKQDSSGSVIWLDKPWVKLYGTKYKHTSVHIWIEFYMLC